MNQPSDRVINQIGVLKPGDRLIIHFDPDIKPYRMRHVLEDIKAHMPDIEVVGFGGGIESVVVVSSNGEPERSDNAESND